MPSHVHCIMEEGRNNDDFSGAQRYIFITSPTAGLKFDTAGLKFRPLGLQQSMGARNWIGKGRCNREPKFVRNWFHIYSSGFLAPHRLHNVKQHNVNVTWRNVTKRRCPQHKRVPKRKRKRNITYSVTERIKLHNVLVKITQCALKVCDTVRFVTLYVL